jgi:hypothetical protein
MSPSRTMSGNCSRKRFCSGSSVARAMFERGLRGIVEIPVRRSIASS